MKYLTTQNIKRIHEKMLAAAGGSPGIRDENAIESAIENAKQSAFGDDLYPDNIAKIAATTFSLVKNHCFVDGNKRVGFTAMMMLLKMNGEQVNATEQELGDVILAVAASAKTRSDLEEWIRNHID